VEHESQYICSACLAGLCAPIEAKQANAAGVALMAMLVAALFCAWFFFYLVGQSLLRIKG
jgi:hypothetical protein